MAQCCAHVLRRGLRPPLPLYFASHSTTAGFARAALLFFAAALHGAGLARGLAARRLATTQTNAGLTETIAMRFEGRLVQWNDERGFGFIEPTQGGQEIFVHVKAFKTRAGRPQIDQVFSFEIELSTQGKKRAKNVEIMRAARSHSIARRESPAQWGSATLFALPLFLVVFLIVGVLWRPPLWFAGIYGAVSAMAFLAYAADKSAARRQTWRTPESTLHLLALAGGWPGALLAQQFLRHKSAKAAFRRAFWATVILNAAGFVALCSPWGRPLWAPP